MLIRISLRIENRERYLIHLDKSSYKSPRDFIQYICKKFNLEEKPDYIILLEPDFVVYDIRVVEKNDKWRLIERKWLQKILQDEESIKFKAIEDKKQLIKSGQWENFTQTYKYAEVKQTGKPITCQLNPFYEPKLRNNTVYGRPSQNYNYYDQRDVRYLIPVKKATRLPEKVDYDDLQNNLLQIITPDFEEFSSLIIHSSNRNELWQTVKLIALLKGFKMIVPYGKQESKITFLCHRAGARKGGNSTKKTNCPFQVTYWKVDKKPNYYLLKFRHNHNHDLNESYMFYGKFINHKVSEITEELRKCKVNNLVSKDNLQEESTCEKTTESKADADMKFQGKQLSYETLQLLNPESESSWVYGDLQIDAICKSMVYWYIENGDVIDPMTEGKLSIEHWTGVMLSSFDYNGNQREIMKTRRLILEVSK